MVEFLSSIVGVVVVAVAAALLICGTVTTVSLLATNATFNAVAKRKSEKAERLAQKQSANQEPVAEQNDQVAVQNCEVEQHNDAVVAQETNLLEDEVVSSNDVFSYEVDHNVVSETGDTIVVRNVDIAGNVSFVSYKKSFTAKLIQSEVDVKNRYSAVKNLIMAYGNMHSRMSWDFDSFNIGRNKVAKLGIKGKTLTLYLALDPEKLKGTKYFVKDVSSVKKYDDVPVKLKLTSKRSVKYASELIEMMMSELSINLNEKAENQNYTTEFKAVSFAKLQAQGLIKEYKITDNDFITKVA